MSQEQKEKASSSPKGKSSCRHKKEHIRRQSGLVYTKNVANLSVDVFFFCTGTVRTRIARSER